MTESTFNGVEESVTVIIEQDHGDGFVGIQTVEVPVHEGSRVRVEVDE